VRVGKDISSGGVEGASTMDGADASAARGCIRSSGSQLRVTRTPSRRDDDTTLPRMTGDAGLLMSTTTSESDKHAAT